MIGPIENYPWTSSEQGNGREGKGGRDEISRCTPHTPRIFLKEENVEERDRVTGHENKTVRKAKKKKC